MSKTTLEMVREFHEAFRHPVCATPNIGDSALNDLRIKLLLEELRELQIGLFERDPVQVLDALSDLQYVLDGAFLALGFGGVKDAAFAEVHRSNMSKLGADGAPVVRPDGKILKGPEYFPPDLKKLLP